MNVIKWTVPVEFNEFPEIKNRNQFAKRLSHCSPEEICKQYVYMTYTEMEQLVKIVTKLGVNILGNGVELGAGCGLLTSAFLNNYKDIDKIYALEIVEELPKTIMKIIAHKYVKTNPEKRLIPVIGSFDCIELFDNSLDFAIEIDSLHHSNNLNNTLTEINRVIKSNGVLIAFDRSHPDSITQKEIENMLNLKYSEDFLIRNNYPIDLSLTRRENGEHEYRLNEWKQAFDKAGFKKVLTYHILPKFNTQMMMKYFFNLIFLKTKTYTFKANVKLLLREFGILLNKLIHFFNGNYIYVGSFRKTLFICYK